MRVTEIEVHRVQCPYHDWIAYEQDHYHGPQSRTIIVAHTDTGLVGLGEGGNPDQELLDRYIGSNPFDWIGDETSLHIGMAMYDLMGQAAGVPIYKLFGQKQRSWVPVASWNVSTHPDRMAESVRRFAAQGFTWMKYHTSPFENVFDQIAAMEEVAPPEFKIHFDFTGGGTTDHMPELLARMAEHRIAGCFEDCIDSGDIQGSIDLRRRIRLPIVRHQTKLDCTFEVLMGAGDVYMRGHQRAGPAMRSAGLFAAGNIPFMLQNVGGTITQAYTAHQMAAYPTANFHFITTAERFAGDVVTERPQPVNGFLRVSEQPGLGLTLDREALERLEALELSPQKPFIIRSRFANGTRMYAYYFIEKTKHFFIRPDWTRGLIPLSHDAPITTDYWDDDGTTEFRQMLERVEQERVVIEAP